MADELGPSIKFDAVPYRADYAWDVQGLLLIAAFLLVGALVLGWMASFISQWFYVIILFPFALGVFLALFAWCGNRLAKLRQPVLAGFAGFVAGCACVAVMHWFDYQQFLDDLRAAPPAVQAQFPPPNQISFLKYLELKATEGVQVAFHQLPLFNLGYIGSFIYWIIELLIVAGVTCIAMTDVADAPFCSSCHLWKKRRSLGRLTFKPEIAKQYVQSGELGRLAEHPAHAGQGWVKLEVAACPSCDGPIEVRLDELTLNDKKEEKSAVMIARVTYPRKALAVLESLFVVQSRN